MSSRIKQIIIGVFGIIALAAFFSGVKSGMTPPEDEIGMGGVQATAVRGQATTRAATSTPKIILTSTITLTPTITFTPRPTATKRPTLNVAQITATSVQKTKTFYEQYDTINRQDLVYYAEEHVGEKVQVPGRVFNIIDSHNFQFFIAGSSDAVVVQTRNKYTNLYENDNVVVYGTIEGKWCGTNAFGAEVCQPALTNAVFVKK